MSMMNLLIPFMRSHYRKGLGRYSFKIGGKHTHKKPGIVPLHVKNNVQKILKDEYHSKLIIDNLERNSIYPFGNFIHKGFRADHLNKAPLIDIPDLSNTKLKPYVTFSLPKIRRTRKEEED